MDTILETRIILRLCRVVVLTLLIGMFQEMLLTLFSGLGVHTWRSIPKIPLIVWAAVTVHVSVKILELLEVSIGRFLLALLALGSLSLMLFWLSPGRYVRLSAPYYGVETFSGDWDLDYPYCEVDNWRYLYTPSGLVKHYARFAQEPEDLLSIELKPFLSWQAGVAAGYLPDDDFDPDTQYCRKHRFHFPFLISVGPLAITDALVKSMLYHMVPLMVVQMVIFMRYRWSLWWDEYEMPG